MKANLAPLALGSDTGGSVRQPASLCGVVGLRPTYGLVSRYGLVAFASSLDQIGPLTKTVEDCAILTEIISGHDPNDSTSASVERREYSEGLDRPLKGRRVGLPKEYFGEGLDGEVKEKVLTAVGLLKGERVEVVDVSLPHTGKSIATYYVLCTAEASSNLARYDGVKYGLRKVGSDLLDNYLLTRTQGFGAEVRRRILLGTSSPPGITMPTTVGR